MADHPLSVQEILRQSKVIAVVGLSRHAYKDSHRVPAYMQRVGFRVIPIHPEADSILGEQAYPSLSALPGSLAAEVDVVNVFRPPAELPGIVDQALEHLPNLKAIWAQKGIAHHGAAETARASGVSMIQDRCMLVEHLTSG